VVGAGDVIELLLRSYLLLPLAGLYAFPKHQGFWLGAVLAMAILAELWARHSNSELKALVLVSSMLLAVAAPVALFVRALWKSRARKFIVAALVVLLGYFALYTSTIYQGEAYLNPDDYCWKAEIAVGPCEPSPWLLAPTAIGLPAFVLVIVGSVPMSLVLLWYGWKRRRAERIARSA
jgi:hypothetical protein